MLTRHGLEEYLSDCVILLDQQVTETVLTRRLRIVKYRGSTHGMNEYPFLIQEDGDMVPASVRIGDRTVPVRLRLKGDMLDHLRTDKWSFRIHTRNDEEILGLFTDVDTKPEHPA